MVLKLFLLVFAAALTCATSNVPEPFSFPEASEPRPFTIKVDRTFLQMTQDKVKSYRPISGLSAEWDHEGPPRQNMTAVADYWASEYDWATIEQTINKDFHHFVTTVPGSGNYSSPVPLHFIHHRASQDDAIPLLLLHGWPSSSLEWADIIGPLSQDPEQPFHIVAPDLPGFGFSPSPKQAGLGPREMGGAFDSLMHQLGYEKYGIVTTDLGWFAGMWMVHDVQDSILGHFSDFYISPPSDTDRTRLQDGSSSAEEAAYISSFDSWFGSHFDYATIHGQKPLALALALADSPVGLLGWFWDINYGTSDGYMYSPEQLITQTMMLWIPGVYPNIRAYREFFKPYVMRFPESRVPTGVTAWGWANGPRSDIIHFPFAPEEWVKRTSNLTFFKKHDSGGHFPAIAKPEMFIEDVREFFSTTVNKIAGQPAVKDEL